MLLPVYNIAIALAIHCVYVYSAMHWHKNSSGANQWKDRTCQWNWSALSLLGYKTIHIPSPILLWCSLTYTVSSNASSGMLKPRLAPILYTFICSHFFWWFQIGKEFERVHESYSAGRGLEKVRQLLQKVGIEGIYKYNIYLWHSTLVSVLQKV